LASGCNEERRPVAEFLRESVVFCSTCTMSSLKSSRSLSHLLMSFLLNLPLTSTPIFYQLCNTLLDDVYPVFWLLILPRPDSDLAWWFTLARCGRSSNIQAWCHHAQMSAWQGSAVPCRLLHTGHWCCWQAASQVDHTANDGGASTSAIHCWPPSIRCARLHGLELLARRPPHTAGLWVL